MGKNPAFLLYARDWLTNPKLRRCSKSARATWIDMICLAHFGEEYGVFISGGRAWLDEELAAALSGDTAANLGDIRELLDKGVAKRDTRGAIYSGRMVRDEQERQQTKLRVRKHRGNADVTPDVTPKKRLCTATANADESIKQIFRGELETFAGDELFEELCESFPKATRDPLTMNEFLQAVERETKRQTLNRQDAAAWIIGRAKRYRELSKFQQKLRNWLYERTYRQSDKAWVEPETKKPSVMDKLYGNDN